MVGVMNATPNGTMMSPKTEVWKLLKLNGTHLDSGPADGTTSKSEQSNFEPKFFGVPSNLKKK